MGPKLGNPFRTAGRAAEEAVYLTGDAVEFGYRVHPGARVGRYFGLLPSGKLGLLPSHRRQSHRVYYPSYSYVRTPSGQIYRFLSD